MGADPPLPSPSRSPQYMPSPPRPEPGQPAPPFETVTASNERIALEDYRGRWVLLYFYPKDDTSGCTKQACNLRDHFGALGDAGIAVLGVSPDDEVSHERFARKYDLPFPLIPDPSRDILTAYGVWGQKTMYGRKVTGVTRTSFVIDPEGIVRHVFKRPNTGKHAEEVLAKHQELSAE
jgi:thioredoxin-dependent peroxiredoxin